MLGNPHLFLTPIALTSLFTTPNVNLEMMSVLKEGSWGLNREDPFRNSRLKHT